MSIEAKRAKRLLAGVLAGALALSVTPILGLTGTAAALEPATGDGSVCEDPPAPEPFTDVADTDPSHEEIECLFNSGITVGTSATTYSPNANVQRRQMALFLVRLADTLEENETSEAAITELPDADGVTPFTDIAAENQETKVAIDRLNEAGIALGTTATTFSPGDNVTREQMAAFIVRLQEFAAGEDATPDNAPDAFNDDEGSFAEEELNILAAEGVYLGVGGGEVNPGDPITRRQMANVLIRKLQYLFEQGDINRLFEEDDVVNNASFTSDRTTTQNLSTEDGAQVTEVTFSGLTPGANYDVVLFPCHVDDDGSAVFSGGEPFVGPDGVSNMSGPFTFNDDEGGTGGQPDDFADDYGSTYEGELEITLIGSTPEAGGADADDNTAPPSGSIRVTIEGDGDNDCGIPVIIEDAAPDTDALPLNDQNEDTLENDDSPAVKFGIAPAVVAFDGVAENGDEPDSNIDYLGAASLFPGLLGTGDDVGVVIHDHGDALVGVDFDADNFYYEGAEAEGPITREQARAFLTIGDGFGTCDGENACNNIDTPYTTTGGNSWLIYEDELPESPSGVTATVGNLDGDSTTAVDDVTVSWTAPSFGTGMGGDVDEYCVEIWSTTAPDGGQADSGCTDEVNSLGLTGDAPTTLTCTATDCELEDLAPGSYRARVYADSETDDSSGYSPWSEAFTVAGPPGALSTAATTNDVDNSGTVTAGDILTVQFDREMDSTPADDTVTLRDADGTTCTFADAGASTFVYSDSQPLVTGADTLTITVGAADNCTAAGFPGGLQYPVTVVAASNVKSLAGGSWDVANSPDKTFE